MVLERNARKIRRRVVADNSSTVLSVFTQHIKPHTTIMLDDGQENVFFDHSLIIGKVFKIPGPIYIDPVDPTKHTDSESFAQRT